MDVNVHAGNAQRPPLGCGHLGKVIVGLALEADFGHGEASFLAGGEMRELQILIFLKDIR